MMWSYNSFFRFLTGIIVEQTMTERWVVIIQVVYETDPLLSKLARYVFSRTARAT